ncbi:hypothetical protein F5144DRAFT_116975 [Chaetomium tenue]|uniref:Uncharacterized protein n=1 Tax=Chaetomium tenue TaxID=1854479 RepID=A0ACB7PJP7_9PEZI|nr:hypothetical protein F5144DRAFT_116975 [Chaetomium globosum]
MSLVEQTLPVGKADHTIGMTNNQVFDDKPEFPLSKATTTFDEPIFDRFDDMDNQDTMAPSPNLANDDVPQLPAKSALRASRMLDNLGIKVGSTAESTTPHDVYLSSEEDASSDADDFSDYDYDSSVEDPTSPTRASHEVTARAVSVVFSGKPSIVDLPATRRRPMSSSSLGTTRSSVESSAPAKPRITRSATTEDRPSTPASATSSLSSRLRKDPPGDRRSMLLSEILTKKKPTFLSIDPYANGSTYTLDIPKALDSLEGETQPIKTPRTPTTLLKGVTRSFSLARRRSRPNLNSPQTAVPKLDTSFATTSNRNSMVSPATVHRVDEEPQQGKQEYEQDQQQQQQQQQQTEQQQQLPRPDQRPKTPVTPITYNDILRAVKRNATVMGAPSPPSDILSPTSPGGPSPATARKGILSGLSARRRSVKLMGKS